MSLYSSAVSDVYKRQAKTTKKWINTRKAVSPPEGLFSPFSILFILILWSCAGHTASPEGEQHARRRARAERSGEPEAQRRARGRKTIPGNFKWISGTEGKPMVYVLPPVLL